VLDATIVTTIGSIINALIVTIAFTFAGIKNSARLEENIREAAEERRILLNAAISQNAAEFRVREDATKPVKPVPERPRFTPVVSASDMGPA